MSSTDVIGVIDNCVFGQLDTLPKHVGFTLNSDTPCGLVDVAV